jgi:hypothetical protein
MAGACIATEIPLRLHEIGPRTLIMLSTEAVAEIPLRFD